MQYVYRDSRTEGILNLICQEHNFRQYFFQDHRNRFLTIAWNTGADQMVAIDGISYLFPSQSILPLMMNQAFAFEYSETIVAWQFNREFYCIVDHDKEVSCVGFLFYGAKIPMFIRLDKPEQGQFEALLMVFYDEFSIPDNIQGEMLRMLLKRLIIKSTRLAKMQYLNQDFNENDLDLVRRFNLLVEMNYRSLHDVKAYADLLNKSPKTLSNLFALYNQPGPLQVIHNRITLEAKRLLLYTDKSIKEIAFALGFEEIPHFSRFFKNQLGVSPSDFKERNPYQRLPVGKN
ncbi:helix-turn-helix domain-containing protein [Spirosoma sp. KNUC1025]|uniref:helix-turn-helix domain-containing protein n=1 Tax=Spirosoma sp. KNUC1025 TaxID=2894082 RepID=UPI003866305D|nr:helix-turn-helix domain-containing protein [Spirosoma sp. KNUC1025]